MLYESPEITNDHNRGKDYMVMRNYQGVWHMANDPGVLLPSFSDGAHGSNNGTSYGGMSSGILVPRNIAGNSNIF
jgi:hypothetical protein